MQLRIITTEREVLRAEVTHVILPGVDGMMDILPGHARLISLLGNGELQYFGRERSDHLLISSGYVEVADDKVSVMIDGDGAKERGENG